MIMISDTKTWIDLNWNTEKFMITNWASIVNAEHLDEMLIKFYRHIGDTNETIVPKRML